MASSSYLLDNNVISYFFNAGLKAELSRITNALSVSIVREVHEEALRYAAKGAEYKKWQHQSALTIRDIRVGGVGSTCLAKLGTATGGLKDLGEFASISLALEDPSLIFVCNDHNAVWIALRELYASGERVVRFTTFLRRANEAIALPRAAVAKLAKQAQVSHGPPTWWEDWIATLQ